MFNLYTVDLINCSEWLFNTVDGMLDSYAVAIFGLQHAAFFSVVIVTGETELRHTDRNILGQRVFWEK